MTDRQVNAQIVAKAHEKSKSMLLYMPVSFSITRNEVSWWLLLSCNLLFSHVEVSNRIFSMILSLVPRNWGNDLSYFSTTALFLIICQNSGPRPTVNWQVMNHHFHLHVIWKAVSICNDNRLLASQVLAESVKISIVKSVWVFRSLFRYFLTEEVRRWEVKWTNNLPEVNEAQKLYEENR